MPKKLNLVPNLRIDLADMSQASAGYSDESAAEFYQRALQGSYSRVLEGFRTEISDAANREITVFSGASLDQSGQLVGNEESLAASRSIILSGDATYFIEVEFIENPSDSSARSLWDPTFDNGLDPSGDPRPDGRESAYTVATRLNHDWQIVSPPSTTAFEAASLPNSTKIPIAVIVVGGGIITTTTVGPHVTTFARSYTAGQTSVKMLDTRILPDSFDMDFGAGAASSEVLSVTLNDRENGLLTLAAPTANAHTVGERAVPTSGVSTNFLDEQVLSDSANAATGGGAISNAEGDARIRLYQGDTETGHALSQDPTVTSGESDIQLKNLKDHIDFLASQLLEVKWGSGTRNSLGTLPPPSDFTSTDYFSRSGGIAPARAHTVSVGDGVTTWGDFNVTTSGGAQEALQAAHDALPLSGGRIYVKGGTYLIVDTPVTITKSVALLGDLGATNIQATGTAAALYINIASGRLSVEDIDITESGSTALFAFNSDAASSYDLVMRNCIVHGMYLDKVSTGSIIEACQFSASAAGTLTLSGDLSGTHFNRCLIQNSVADAAARCISLLSVAGPAFSNCIILGNSSMTALVEATTSSDMLSFHNCDFRSSGITVVFLLAASATTNMSVTSCKSNLDAGLGTFQGVDGLRINDCTLEVPQDGSAVILEAASSNVDISGNRFTQLSTTPGTSGVGVDVSQASRVTITGNSFQDCDYGIYLYDATDVSLPGNTFKGTTGTSGRAAIASATNGAGGTETWRGVSVTACSMDTLQDPSVTTITGILVTLSEGLVVSGCAMRNLGLSANNANVYGVRSTSVAVQASITGNSFTDLHASANAVGVEVTGTSTSSIDHNDFKRVGSDGNCAAWYGVSVSEFSSLSISGNTLQDFGDSASSSSGSAVIHVGSSGQLEGSSVGLSVSGNTIRDVSGNAGSFYGIHVELSGEGVSIQGNTISGSNAANFTGIFCNATSTDASDIDSLTVLGNVIRGSFNHGVYLSLEDSTVRSSGSITLSGNSIDGFAGTGMLVIGSFSAVTALQHLAISGNTLVTTLASVRCLDISYVYGLSLSGNIIGFYPSGATSNSMILLRDTESFSVSGNVLTSTTTGVLTAINTDATTTYGTVTGNMIRTTADTGAGEGINPLGTPATVFFSANAISMLAGTEFGTGSGIIATDSSGATANLNHQP